MHLHLFLLVLITRNGITISEGSEELDSYPDGDYPVLEPREAGQWLNSGSGSGSGSDDILLPNPVSTTNSLPTVVPEYGTTFYITLTFHNLTKHLYQDNDIGGKLTDLLVRLLELAVVPLVVFDEENGDTARTTIVVYFPMETSSRATLQTYAELLASTADPVWRTLVEPYGLSSVEVVEVSGTPMPWWHWLIIALVSFMAVLAYSLLILACCCRYWGGVKNKNPSKVSHTEQDIQIQHGYSEQISGFQMKEQSRQQLVRKVSRVSYQPKSHTHFYSHRLSLLDLEQVIVNQSSLVAEYTAVPTNMVTMAEVPAGAEDKNRYKDVLPNPQTRVALFLKFGVANSDYINANYIRGYRSTSKSYVATQGPLLWTVADFWRMVWEQRVTTIIMTTKLQEKGMAKCVQYWPEERHGHSVVYEALQIHLRRRIITKSYSTTTLLLQHQDKMVCREVTHFWFTGWPDHGVPSSTHSLVEFLLHVKKHTTLEMPGPTLVHCSAGIGRTGVVIAADIAMQQLVKEGEVDLLRILSSLRQDRGGMIQTKEQYVFLHQVVLEYAKREQIGKFAVTHQRLETTTEEDEPADNEDTTALLS